MNAHFKTTLMTVAALLSSLMITACTRKSETPTGGESTTGTGAAAPAATASETTPGATNGTGTVTPITPTPAP